ncbi:MAG: hypothetical protein RL456_3160 [Pseudomonadota bacterium]|jgi:uncharacterized membrane protein YeaQ/YmgE (transglycosylase-associated protein family)
MGLIWMIVVGFVIGLLARAILPGTQALGFILTTLVGIGGSLVAGYVGQAMGWYTVGQPVSFIASVVGAMALLFVVGKIKGA